MTTGRPFALPNGWSQGWDVQMTQPDGRAAIDEVRNLGTLDDRALVEAFLHGRREAFDVIVERHQRQVYRLCFRFVPNHADAADLTQDVFVRAFRHLARFKHESALRTWLYRIAVNLCLTRASGTRVPAGESIDHLTVPDRGGLDPLKAVLANERACSVRQAIARLPRRQRATVVLRIYQGLSHQEIADVLGGTVGAAKTNLCHALGNLRKWLRP